MTALRLYPFFTLLASFTVYALEPSAEVKPIIDKVITAIGGKDKILTTFRMEEWYAVAEAAPTAQPRKVTRTSVLQPPLVWWANGKDRGDTQWNEDVWGWSLAVLLDAKSIIKPTPDITEEGQPAYGLSITGSLDTEMRLYFSHATNLLVRMDLRNQSYHFSHWKEQDGLIYSSQCVIKKQPANKPWFHHEILKLERLKELPADLKR
jgi:hypothetical protein